MTLKKSLLMKKMIGEGMKRTMAMPLPNMVQKQKYGELAKKGLMLLL